MQLGKVKSKYARQNALSICKRFLGVVPNLAARAYSENLPFVVQNVMEKRYISSCKNTKRRESIIEIVD